MSTKNKHKKSNSKVLSKKRYLKFLILCVVVAIGLFFISMFMLFLKQNLILNKTDINVTIGVSDYIGLNKDTDKLHMGTSFPGGKMYVNMNITSLEEGYLFITFSGGNEREIGDWVYISKQGSQVIKGDIVELSFEGRPTVNASYGKYESTLHVYLVKREKLSWFERIYIEGELLNEIKEIPLNSDLGGDGKILISILNVNESSNQNRSS
ncbi:MAG: hypothetical protein ACP5N2_00455 [Candidatus Nanoarchaeia archaeon]